MQKVNQKKNKEMPDKPITQKVKGPGGPVTLPTVTVTAKKITKPKTTPATNVYIIGEPGKQNKEVSKSQYDMWKGKKITMRKDDPRLKDLGVGGYNVPRGYKKK